MSTLAEVQEATAHLSEPEQKALALWLDSHLAPDPGAAEERELLRSLDTAITQVDTGQGVPLVEARRRVRAWASE